MTDVRADIPSKYKWDLSTIYSSEATFNEDFQKAEALVADYPKHEKTIISSAQGLYAALCDFSSIMRVVTKLFEFASRSFDVDMSVNANQALVGKVYDLYVRASAAAYFIRPYILKLSKETLDSYFKSYPKLEEYRRFIDGQFRYKPYTLSDECEKLLADTERCLGTHSDIYSIFTDSDMRFGKIKDDEGNMSELTDATYVTFLMSRDRNVRRGAFNRLYKVYGQYRNTIATIMNGFVREKTTIAKNRGFADSLTASVFDDETTPDIYNNLIDTVNKNLEPLFEYYDLKRELLGLSKLHMYDLYPQLIGECDRKYSYEEAVEEVLDAVKILGDEYHDALEAGFKQKSWVDVYPNRGKRGGAYSAGCYDSEPLMLMNYTGTLNDVSTLAHEAGHSMHSYFSKKSNPFHESDYTIFVAEVASTVNELIYSYKKLNESKSRAEKLSVLNQIMETYKGTLYRQTMFAEFEKKMHALSEAGEVLTADLLCGEYYAIVKKYFGPRVVCDKQIEGEWMRIPHFYRNFYVYKYATCISAASSIVKKIFEQGDAYIGKYLDFLKCGGSKSPLDSLLVADIDLTKPEVIEDAVAMFADTVRQFREIYQSQE